MAKKYILGCTGHINLSRIQNFDEQTVREKIRTYFRELLKSNAVELYSGLAFGADCMFAEEALSCGVTVHAVLPYSAQEFATEQPDGGTLFNRLINKAQSVVLAENGNVRYLGVSTYIVNQCDELLAIWNGVKLPLTDEGGNPVNRGGTYHTVLLAEKAGKPVRIFN